MFTLYLACLLAGGALVALSAFSGMGDDLDVGGGEVDLDGEVEIEYASLAEASHGVDTGRSVRKGPWLPFLSFRFWTFGAAFFGLTGVVLTTLSLSVEPVTVMLSSGVGLGVGAAAAYVIRALRRPVGASKVTAQDFQGVAGEMLLPLKAGGLSKVRVVSGGSAQELVVVAGADQVLPRGARVVVTHMDGEGRAHVTSEHELLGFEEA